MFLPDCLSGYIKNLNFEEEFKLCEWNTLNKLIDFLAARVREKTEDEDFKILLRIIEKFLMALSITTEHKERRKYVDSLYVSITSPSKRNKKNNFGGRTKLIELKDDEASFIKRDREELTKFQKSLDYN